MPARLSTGKVRRIYQFNKSEYIFRQIVLEIAASRALQRIPGLRYCPRPDLLADEGPFVMLPHQLSSTAGVETCTD